MTDEEFTFKMAVYEQKDLEEICEKALELGPSLGLKTYIVRKLLYHFLRKLPEGHEFIFTTQTNSQGELEGVVKFVKQDQAEKTEV